MAVKNSSTLRFQDIRVVVGSNRTCRGARLFRPLCDALFEAIDRNIEKDDMIEGQPLSAQESFQSLGLGHRARKPVKDEACRGGTIAQALFDETDDDIVGYELARIDRRLGLEPERCTGLDCMPQEITCRDMPQATLADELFRLRALSGARRANEDKTRHDQIPMHMYLISR